MKNVYNSITEMVGRTPLLSLNKLAKQCKSKARILGKCEFYNPLFSVKDRVALKMIEAAEAGGEINENTVFVEATSGNTGIGLAAMCAAKGYKLVITMPENMSQERIMLMRHFGAEVILTPKDDGMKGALAKAELLVERNPDAIMMKQFYNEANPDAHRFGTSIEILEDTGGEVDVLVSAVGTSGTLTGIASTLRTGAHKIPGIGAGFVPPFYNDNLVNEVMDITDEEALDTARETAKSEGLPVGISAGAALCAALKIGQRPEMKGKNIVVILPDAIERYLSVI